MPNVFIADLTNKKLRRSLGGGEFQFPQQTHKGFITFGLRFSVQQGTRHVAEYPKVREIRACVGEIDLRPEWGEYTLQVGAQETAPIAWDADAAAIQSAIDALGYTSTVEEDGATFVIYDVPDPITEGSENCLRPMTFARVHTYQQGIKTAQALRLQRAPLAFTDSYRLIVPDAPFIEEVEPGGSNAGIEYPAVQKLTVPLDFAGSYILRTADGVQKSRLFGVVDGPEEISAGINPSDDNIGLAPDSDGEFLVTEHPTDPAALIEFRGSMIGIPQAPLIVDVVDAPDADYWIDLDLDTTAMAQAFRDTEADAARDVLREPLEIYADFEDEDDPAITRTYLIYREDLTIHEAVTHEDLAAPQSIDYLKPPARSTYQPVDPSQLSTGTRFFEFTVAAGAGASQTVTHSLTSPRVNVYLRENTAGGRLLQHGVDYELTHDNDDQITVQLLGAYASVPSDLAGVVMDLTLTSTWLGHTHDIADIIGLQTILDGMASQISQLLSLAPVGALTLPAEPTYTDTWTLPDFFQVFPIIGRSKVITPESMEVRDLDQTQLPTLVPALQPAIHADPATAVTLPTATQSGELIPADPVEAQAGELFENTSGQDIIIGLISPLETEEDQFGFSYTLKPGQFATHDGSDWYPLSQYGAAGDSSFYSRLLERTLFEDTISASQLLAGRNYEVRFAIDVAALRANTPWHWHVVIEVAALTQETAPAGSNLLEDSWRAEPVLDERIVLMSTPRRYTFGYRVLRAKDGSLSAESLSFGAWSGSAAPDDAEFAIRARLVRADTVNRVSEPRGFLVVGGLGFDNDGDDKDGTANVSS